LRRRDKELLREEIRPPNTPDFWLKDKRRPKKREQKRPEEDVLLLLLEEKLPALHPLNYNIECINKRISLIFE
jgi:hypothetical protein